MEILNNICGDLSEEEVKKSMDTELFKIQIYSERSYSMFATRLLYSIITLVGFLHTFINTLL
ncbi:MAG: hypothetical protein QG670_2724 [Thermoproteota archaeon]|nr:hypothetical protein [Thermoproteota archaeon]